MDPRNQMFNPQPMGPYHFYGPPPGTEGFIALPPPAPSGPPNPTPAIPPRSPRVSSPSPSPVKPAKRPRGRPRKSRDDAATAAKAATVKAKVAATKAKGNKSKVKTSSEKEKENQPVTPIEVDDSSDSEVEGASKGQWKHPERSKVFTFILAFDDNGNKRFEQLKKNPSYVFKRAEELLFPGGKRSKKSIQNMWGRSLETFGWIRAFEGFTGNGGGDPDSEDPTAVLAYRLKGARSASVAVGSLKPETITLWEDQGWLDLFNARYSKNPKVARAVVRNSAAAISDIEDDDVAILSQNSDDNINPLLRGEPKTPAPRKNATAIVSERKHTPASQLRTQATSSFGNIGEFMKIKMASEEKKSKAIDARLELDRLKLELEQARVKTEEDRSRADMARTVLSAPGVSDEVKNAANAFLLNLFK
ncbi:hypothetical protein C8F04DRAFT_1231840 [Mycena alexandri]|uniref:No apical meristem-associated C-terminal domain-containing protein n=1 Tax=Mycena alexandri TaxID=1745969 RepID=A0AAD6T3R5_9AGAR|nr:hypothetical protein C8F04DRAFT_1231840 [Mycena alexandri]